MKKFKYIVSSIVGLLAPLSLALAIDFRQVFLGATCNPNIDPTCVGGTAPNANILIILLQDIGGFLIIAGSVLAGIALIVAGVIYMSAGNNSTRVGAAKAWFKNGIIGAIILFAVGIILNTLSAFLIDPTGFFN